MEEMQFDVQAIFLMELIGVLDEKRPTEQADAMLKLAQWYRDELDDVARYVEESREPACETTSVPGSEGSQ